MGKVLAITGAAGKKTARAFIENLARENESIAKLFTGGIRALVRKTSRCEELIKLLPNVEVCVGELDDEEYLRNCFIGVDTIVHIAGIHNSRHIISAAVASKVRRVIFVHTTGIYSKYKAAGEEYRCIDKDVYEVCQENGILLTICRPTMIYGNVHDGNVVKFIKMVDKLPVMPVVNGAKYELQPVHYNDLGMALYSILINEEKTANKDYILSGGEPILLRDMLTLIGKELGKKVRFVSCPYLIAYTGAWLIYCISLRKIDYREKVQRLCEPRVFSYEEAHKDFGYLPIKFEIGIVEEVKEYKNNS